MPAQDGFVIQVCLDSMQNLKHYLYVGVSTHDHSKLLVNNHEYHFKSVLSSSHEQLKYINDQGNHSNQ